MGRRRAQRGQVLVMVSVAMFAVCGLVGLATDLGWSHFVKKSAQSAGDAAALAAVQSVLSSAGQLGSVSCGGPVVCQEPTPCSKTLPVSAGDNVEAGCLYAARHGFTHEGRNQRQSVIMEANVGPAVPTARGVRAEYWVTARVSERVPSLFGRLFQAASTPASRATAAIVDVPATGSLLLTNHESDCLPIENPNQLTCGVNLLVSSNDNGGESAVRADGGIYLASQADGSNGRYAGENTGGGTVEAPFTYIRGHGSYHQNGSSQWIAAPRNLNDDSRFADPMRGKSQPRPPTGLPDRPVLGGVIQGGADAAHTVVFPPGNYFASSVDKHGNTVATGEPLEIRGHVQFGSGFAFGEYVFFGGVNIANSGTTATFAPGMYVLAGTKEHSGKPQPLFDIKSNANIKDLTPGFGQNTDAGELFVFTDTNYVGSGQSLEIPALVAPVAAQLKHGTAGFQSGNSGSTINLHGLNRDVPAVPEDLRRFAPVVIWQDQANSVVKYTPDGNIDTSCGNADGCPNTALSSNQSPQLFLQGSPDVHLYGTAYQPRGAWTSIVGGGSYEVPVQVIAGAFRVQGNANFSMIQLPSPVTRRAAALVE